MGLKEYKSKRNFDKTSEPVGRTRKSSRRPIFCVQHHMASHDHYDFRLEYDGVLLSWAVPKGPSFNPADKRLAVHVEDHPTDYADFEGTIPKGEYGGGIVMLWDIGEYEEAENFKEGLKKGSLKFILHGERLKGRWALVKLKDDDKNWLLIKDKDEYAKKTAGISGHKTGVKSGRTMSEIESGKTAQKTKSKSNPFKSVSPMLATLTSEVPKDDKAYFYEVKYDGYRAIAFVEKGKVRFVSRNNKEFSKFDSLCDSLQAFAGERSMVLDGEVIVPDEEGRSDFQALQNYMRRRGKANLIYMVFDLLALDGEDLRKLPLRQRKERLEDLLKGAPSDICYSSHVEGGGKACFKAAEKAGLEGIVAKRADSKYIEKRSEAWLKLKCYKRQEFVVVGYTESEKKALAALLLAVSEEGELDYIGRAGTGFGEAEAKELLKKFKKLEVKKPQFKNLPKMSRQEIVHFLKPTLVAEIQFAEVTEENLLRQASYKGLRIDKSAGEVVLEKPKTINKKQKLKDDGILVEGIRISSPDKLIYKKQKLTKLDVIKYYHAVAPRMLDYAGGRIISAVRCHEGVEGEKFYKKHPDYKCKNIKTLMITNDEGEESEYYYVTSVAGLVQEAQLGTLEFHVWGSKVKTLEKPDMMVFDLDPDEKMPLDKVREGVRDLKKVLEMLGLKSFLKTSGGKGYHVVVPFQPYAKWDAFHDFAKKVADLMESKWPNKYTSNMRKEKRKGKIFIDWARNGRGSTSVAPYSLRARVGAPVSMPIKWSELDTVSPNGIDMQEALKRIKRANPWKNFFEVKQKLKL